MQAQSAGTRSALMGIFRQPRPYPFWSDLASVIAAVGWIWAGVALMTRPSPSYGRGDRSRGARALCRGLSTFREISHLRRLCLPGFETV